MLTAVCGGCDSDTDDVIAGIQQAIVNVTETLKAGTGNRNDAFFAHGLSKMKEWSPRPPFDVTLEIGQGCDWPVTTLPYPLRSCVCSALSTQYGTDGALHHAVLSHR